MTIIDTVVEFAAEAADTLAPEDRDLFWKCLSNAAGKRVRRRVETKDRPEWPRPSAMTDAEAAMFERTAIPFGAHKGDRVCEVNLSYLENLADDKEFIRDLRRYLRSGLFVRKRRAEGDE